MIISNVDSKGTAKFQKRLRNLKKWKIVLERKKGEKLVKPNLIKN